MAPTTNEQILGRVLELITQRADTYRTGLQTTVCWKSDSGWLNSITKLEFIRKGERPVADLSNEYENLRIIRRHLTPNELATFLKQLFEKRSLEIGSDTGALSYEASFSISASGRRYHSEWSQWPSDIFEIQPSTQTGWPPDQPLISVNAPYYPSLEYVLSDFFGIRNQGWTNYMRGQVMVILPDFRARISKLTVGLTYVKADVECVFIEPSKLLMKAYAENRNERLAQETIQLKEPVAQLDFSVRPSFVSMALMSTTGDVLDQKVFQEGASWRQPNVIAEEPLKPEIEQLLLTGEGENIEFKEKLDTNSQRLAKTAVAFANTSGGTIVIGVDDDQRVVGCNARGLAETITNILRSRCDPPPNFTTKITKHENKELFLVQIAQSSDVVHVVKELGPFIRANRSNRTPTSHELEQLRRRNSESGIPLFLR